MRLPSGDQARSVGVSVKWVSTAVSPLSQWIRIWVTANAEGAVKGSEGAKSEGEGAPSAEGAGQRRRCLGDRLPPAPRRLVGDPPHDATVGLPRDDLVNADLGE